MLRQPFSPKAEPGFGLGSVSSNLHQHEPLGQSLVSDPIWEPTFSMTLNSPGRAFQRLFHANNADTIIPLYR